MLGFTQVSHSRVFRPCGGGSNQRRDSRSHRLRQIAPDRDEMLQVGVKSRRVDTIGVLCLQRPCTRYPWQKSQRQVSVVFTSRSPTGSSPAGFNPKSNHDFLNERLRRSRLQDLTRIDSSRNAAPVQHGTPRTIRNRTSRSWLRQSRRQGQYFLESSAFGTAGRLKCILSRAIAIREN